MKKKKGPSAYMKRKWAKETRERREELTVTVPENPVTYWVCPGEACFCVYALLGKNKKGEWVWQRFQKCASCYSYHGDRGLSKDPDELFWHERHTDKYHPKDIKYWDGSRWEKLSEKPDPDKIERGFVRVISGAQA